MGSQQSTNQTEVEMWSPEAPLEPQKRASHELSGGAGRGFV